MLKTILLTVITTALAAADWHHALDEGLKIAQVESKDVLVLFTGSDWCQPCHNLDKEVLSRSDFLTHAAERFVLVELDFPRRHELPPEQAAANAAARETYAVTGYPTILLLRPDGSRYAATGYMGLGAKAYLAHIDELIAARDQGPALLAASEATTGVERTKALDAIIKHRDLVREDVSLDDLRAALAADPDDVTGLRAAYSARLAREERSAAMAAAQKTEDRATVRTLIAEGLSDTQQNGDYRQGLRYRLAMMSLQDQDMPAAVVALDAAIAEDTKSSGVATIKRMRDAIAASIKKREAQTEN